MRLAERDQAHHVTLLAGTVLESLPARAWYLLFLTSLLNWLSGVNRDKAKSYIGIGAFNLVHGAAYRQCCGYEALRLTVLDDVKLGQLLRRCGKRTRGFLGAADVECHWGSTVWSMMKIMEKNYFAALDFRVSVVVACAVFMTLVFSIPNSMQAVANLGRETAKILLSTAFQKNAIHGHLPLRSATPSVQHLRVNGYERPTTTVERLFLHNHSLLQPGQRLTFQSAAVGPGALLQGLIQAI